MDGSVIRPHARVAGAANSFGNEAMGRSKGGFSDKVDALRDALGSPIKFILTGGQKAECKQRSLCLKTFRLQPFRRTKLTTTAHCERGWKSDK